MTTIYCGKCESANPEDAVVCSLCGHELQRRKADVTHTTKRPAHRLWWSRPAALGAGTLLLVASVVAVVQLVLPATAHRKPSVESATAPTALDATRAQPTDDTQPDKVSDRTDRAGESPPTARAVGWLDLIRPKEVIDQSKYELLYRAGKTMTTATEVGVNRVDFNHLVQELSTEVKVAADKVAANPSDRASTMVKLYGHAAAAYASSTEFWQMAQSEHLDEYWGGKIPFFSLADAEAIRAKYGVDFTEEKAAYTEKPFYGFPKQLPQIIWTNAAKDIAQAERIYLGQPENP